jgi:tyrosine-protein kinase Etk/Wzc
MVDPVNANEANDANEKDGSITIVDFLSVLLRHKKMIIIGTGGAIVAVAVYCIISIILPPTVSYLPNVYKPHAETLIINPDQSGGLSSMLSSSGLGGLAGMAGVSLGGGLDYGTLAVSIATGNTILDILIDKYKLREIYKIKKNPKTETRSALLKYYSASYDEKTGIFTISFIDKDPVMACDLVNTAVDLLDKHFLTIGGNRNITRRDQLESKLVDVQAEMTRIEGEIQQFQQKYGILTVDSVATEQVSTVAQLRSQLIMKEMEIKTYGDLSKVQDPALMRLKTERDNLSQLLGELEKGFSQYEKVLPTQKELPKLAIEFGHMQRDLLVQEKIFELLTQQLELTKLEIAGSDPIIQLLEAAEVPDEKSGPSRAMICIVVTFVAFFVTSLAAFAIEAIKKIQADPIAMGKLKGVRM